MDTLPKSKSERIVGEEYDFKGEIRIWDGCSNITPNTIQP